MVKFICLFVTFYFITTFRIISQIRGNFSLRVWILLRKSKHDFNKVFYYEISYKKPPRILENPRKLTLLLQSEKVFTYIKKIQIKHIIDNQYTYRYAQNPRKLCRNTIMSKSFIVISS